MPEFSARKEPELFVSYCLEYRLFVAAARLVELGGRGEPDVDGVYSGLFWRPAKESYNH